MKVFLFLVFLITQICCTNNYSEVYSKSTKSGWHKIDLKYFELETPKKYKYKPHQGIDSYVGEVANKKVSFSFDYGRYSNNEPLTPHEILEKYLFNFYLEDLLDTMNVSNDSTNLVTEIRDSLIVIKVFKEENKRYKAELEFKKQIINFPFELLSISSIEKSEDYEFLIDANEDYFKKIYLPKNLNTNNRAGVYIEDLKTRKKNTFNNKFNSTKLSFSTTNINEKNKEEILEILKSLQMKN